MAAVRARGKERESEGPGKEKRTSATCHRSHNHLAVWPSTHAIAISLDSSESSCIHALHTHSAEKQLTPNSMLVLNRFDIFRPCRIWRLTIVFGLGGYLHTHKKKNGETMLNRAITNITFIDFDWISTEKSEWGNRFQQSLYQIDPNRKVAPAKSQTIYFDKGCSASQRKMGHCSVNGFKLQN